MKDAGFYTVSSILMKTKKQLMSVKGLSEPKVDKIRDAAVKLNGVGFMSGAEAQKRRMNVIHITTGSDALNEILGGGIESGSLTEAYGTSRNFPSFASYTPYLTFCRYAQVSFVAGRRSCRTRSA